MSNPWRVSQVALYSVVIVGMRLLHTLDLQQQQILNFLRTQFEDSGGALTLLLDELSWFLQQEVLNYYPSQIADRYGHHGPIMVRTSWKLYRSDLLSTGWNLYTVDRATLYFDIVPFVTRKGLKRARNTCMSRSTDTRRPDKIGTPNDRNMLSTLDEWIL
jgi:hypothetical protein